MSKFCTYCGNKLNEQDKFCEHCGNKTKNYQVDNSSSKYNTCSIVGCIIGLIGFFINLFYTSIIIYIFAIFALIIGICGIINDIQDKRKNKLMSILSIIIGVSLIIYAVFALYFYPRQQENKRQESIENYLNTYFDY